MMQVIIGGLFATAIIRLIVVASTVVSVDRILMLRVVGIAVIRIAVVVSSCVVVISLGHSSHSNNACRKQSPHISLAFD